MAGIKGQPSAKPQDLKSPVPSTKSALDDYAEDTGTGGSALDSYAVEAVSRQEASSAPEEIQQIAPPNPWYVDALPTALGIAGGVAGAPFGPAGMVVGAAAGGAAGVGYRQMIEQNVLKKPINDPNAALTDVATGAVEEGAGQLVGMGIAKGAAKVAKTVAPLVKAPIKYIRESIQAARDGLEAPTLKIIAERTNALTSEQSGDAAKSLLKQNIQTKYGPFIKAYEDLDAVSKSMPVQDEVRRGFTQKLKAWGLENHGGDNWKIIKKYADDIDAAGNGMQIDDVIGQISDAKNLAYTQNANKQYMMLKELQERATNFVEGETTKLAARVQAGKATSQEIAFLNELAARRGIAEPDPTKYAKTLAKDYLAAKDKVKSDYAGFRSFLEDVGEQTKTKATKKGPMAFLSSIDDVPSEKLIERMFDPKNAAALRRMQSETPEVFQEVVKAKMNQIVQKSSPTGTLDLKAYAKELNKIPVSTRSMLLSPDEAKTVMQTVNDVRLEKLQRLNERAESYLFRWGDDVSTLMSVAKPMPRSKAAAQQVVGDSAIGLGKLLVPMINRPKSEQ